MPRIDPIQLLNCLSVLLSKNGGIKSREEVHRIVNLMTKYSKKLVSKCIYIQILKCTETELLNLFMEQGWRLVHVWLTESLVARNWALVRELLELLLLCPVDIGRLKTNNCPKLVKDLSKDCKNNAIRALASKLVEQWLKTVKGEGVVPISITHIQQIIAEASNAENISDVAEVKPEIKTEVCTDEKSDEKAFNEVENKLSEIAASNIETNEQKSGESSCSTQENEESDKKQEVLPVLKITVKDGKQVISQSIDSDNKSEEKSTSTIKEKAKDKHKSRSKEKSHDKSSSNNSKSSPSKHSSKSRSSSTDKHKSGKDSPSRHSSKEKSKDKHKYSSNSSKSKHSDSSSSSRSSEKSSSSSRTKHEGSTKHSSSKDKDKAKEKSRDEKNDRNKDDSPKPSSNIAESKTPSIHKLGKIPKLSDVKKEKPSISIEVRKPDEPKPKTVKTFNSKFRKHGLEEEVKPPPSRASLLNKKVPPPVPPPTVSIIKRPSPVHNDPPPEKKPKTTEIIEKPGAIKLIPPKPKPMMLLESDMFMDALNASATNKKEPKKRKRRTSGSKDTNGEGSPPNTPTAVSSPSGESKSVPPRFYQDTLDTEEDKEKAAEKSTESGDPNKGSEKDDEPMDTSEPHTLTVNGLKGVLCYHKKKGPKKSIKWKPDCELEEIQYFELDETERVNVTKTFTDMKYLERVHEREAFQKARNLSNDDVMEEKTSWRPLIPVDAEGQIQVEYGKHSKEREIQAVRQKATLQPLYFPKSLIPDSPSEPDIETHTFTEPANIPLDDVTGNQDNVSDFRNMPWPEPKGNAPPPSSNINVPSMFPPNMAQFPSNFPGPFPNAPGFPGPNMTNMMPGDWPNGVPPHMMPNGIPGPMPPTVLPPGPIPGGNIPPGMMVPPENMMMSPDMFNAPNPMFPVTPDGFNVPPNMFPMDFNMAGPGPQGMQGPDGFVASGNFRGGARGRGNVGHWRGKVNWEGPQRGRGGIPRGSGRKTVCIYFQRKGSCRQGDSCTFLHPGVNCPF